MYDLVDGGSFSDHCSSPNDNAVMAMGHPGDALKLEVEPPFTCLYPVSLQRRHKLQVVVRGPENV